MSIFDKNDEEIHILCKYDRSVVGLCPTLFHHFGLDKKIVIFVLLTSMLTLKHPQCKI